MAHNAKPNFCLVNCFVCFLKEPGVVTQVRQFTKKKKVEEEEEEKKKDVLQFLYI